MNQSSPQSIHDIFAIWGSVSTMANDLGEKRDTVFRWKLRERIPEDAWGKIIERAAMRERLVTASDLLKVNKPMKKRGRPVIRKRRSNYRTA